MLYIAHGVVGAPPELLQPGGTFNGTTEKSEVGTTVPTQSGNHFFQLESQLRRDSF